MSGLEEEMDIYITLSGGGLFRIASRLKRASLIRIRILHVMKSTKLTRAREPFEVENGAALLIYSDVVQNSYHDLPSM